MQKVRIGFLVVLGLAFLALLWWFPARADPWSIAGGFFNLALVLLGAFVTLQPDRTTRHKTEVLAAFGFLGFLGFWVSARVSQEGVVKTATAEAEKAASEAKTGQADARRDASLAEVEKHAKETARIQALNTQLQERLLRSSEVIARLGRLSINTATGGDGYAYMAIAQFSDDSATVVFTNMGKYPLYDVTARVVDMDAAKSLKVGALLDTLSSDIANYSVGELAPGTGRMETRPLPLRKSKLTLSIVFYARNGNWAQSMKIVRLGPERWSYGYVVSKSVPGRGVVMLKKRIDKDFPVEELPKDWP